MPDDTERRSRPPAWAREELILALDLYFGAGRRWLPPRDRSVVELSDLLNALDIHSVRGDPAKFRNPSAVAMKLANFLSLDPTYTDAGRSGLTRAGHLDKRVWDEFANDPDTLREVALGLRATVGERVPEVTDAEAEEAQSYADGRYAYRVHRVRERNRRLTECKRLLARSHNAYVCEVCGLAPLHVYGGLGRSVLECHHRLPLSQYRPGQRTKIEDLALVCASCHRALHASPSPGAVDELRDSLPLPFRQAQAGVVDAALAPAIAMAVADREAARAIKAARRDAFFREQREAFERGESRFFDRLPDGRIKRRATSLIYPTLDEAMAGMADELAGLS
jgi:5-methylcytosine-specific restriction enzyme A